MKIKRLGLEWGAAHEEAHPVSITHGDAQVTVYVSEGGDLVIHTVRGQWVLSSFNGGSDCKLVVRSC